MLTAASCRVKSGSVEFIHGTVWDIPPANSYDVVITHFFLDLFNESALRILVDKIESQLTPGGQWLIADFVNKRWWHAACLSLMYFFFFLTCSVKTRSLPSWRKVLEETLKCKMETSFYGDFISSCSFVRQPG